MALTRAFSSVLRNNVRKLRYYSSNPAFEEVKIPVPWGHVAGKWWNPSDKRPILTIHGWQDNCGSFDRLIPLLNPKVSFLAIDLPGHGYSSRIPSGLNYYNFDHYILIKYIADYFQWENMSLMGHSLGAISSFMYTTIFPQTVDFLICIDGVKPILKENNMTRLGVGIQEFFKYDQMASSTEKPPSYPLEVIKKKVSDAMNNSIDIEYAHQALIRNARQSKKDPSKYYFTRDPRLKTRIITNWPQNDVLEGAARVTPPILLLKFTESGYFEDPKYFKELWPILQKASRDAQYHLVEGKHHAHINNPERIHEIINNFINSYDTESREAGGILRGIVNQ